MYRMNKLCHAVGKCATSTLMHKIFVRMYSKGNGRASEWDRKLKKEMFMVRVIQAKWINVWTNILSNAHKLTSDFNISHAHFDGSVCLHSSEFLLKYFVCFVFCVEAFTNCYNSRAIGLKYIVMYLLYPVCLKMECQNLSAIK